MRNRGVSPISTSVFLVAVLAGCAGVSDRRPLPSASIHAELDPASPLGVNWVFVEVDGYDGVLPGPRPQPGFNLSPGNGRMSGSTGCNPMNSAFVLDTDALRLRFRLLNNGRRICSQEMGRKEDAVLSAMIATDHYELAGSDLILMSKGRQVARLSSAVRVGDS